MPTLNTLRTRGALILTIFIGVALIAFLLQDLTGAGSMFNNRRNRVGSIEGNSIDYMEFMSATDNLSRIIQNLYGRSSLTAEETDQVRDMVWESYMRRYSYNPGFRRLGLMVGEAEQLDMIRGQFVSPVISAMFANPETGIYDPAVVENFIANMAHDGSGMSRVIWDYIKGEMIDERMSTKFMSLLAGAIYAGDLETAQGVRAANNAFSGRFVSIPFTQIPDSLVKVTSADIKRFYNENRRMFRQSASRDIEYVVFTVLPSESDYAEARAHIDNLAEEFAAAELPMQFASLNSQARTDHRFLAEEHLTTDLAAIAFGDRRGEMFGPVLNGDVYTISRVADTRMMPDSVGARHILLDRTRAASADSIVRAIRAGRSIFELAPLYSMDPTVDLGVFTPEMMVEPFADAVIAANRGDVFTVETQFGVHVVEMTYKAPMRRRVQIATITYNVEPSAATQQEVFGRARDFLTIATGSRANFNAAVDEAGVGRRVATITERDRNVRGLNDSRELVRWSFNSKPDVVSPIMTVDGDYVVAVVTGARETGFASLSDVSSDIATRLRNDRKAALIGEQFAGRTIESAAELAGARSGEFEGVRFSSFFIPDLGVEPAVIGALTAVPAGGVSRPIKGLSGVFLVAVDSIDHMEEATAASERVRIEAMAETGLPQRVGQALLEETDVVDNRAKFF